MLFRTSEARSFDLLGEKEGRLAIVATLLVWFVSSILFVVPMLVGGEQLSFYMIGSLLFIATAGSLVSFALMLTVWRLFDSGIRNKTAHGMLVVLIAACVLTLLDLAAGEFFASIQPGNQLAPTRLFRATNNFAVFIPHFALLAAIYGLLAHNRDAALRERLLAEANALAQQARLSALRYQLNPHFLFNTLNSISSLVVTKRNRDAERMLTALSEFLRATLSRDPEDPQTLEMELETITSYLAIERIRFGERLAMEIDCPAALRNAGIPPFLMQPLVENAIKHAVAETEETVTIALSAQRDNDDLVVVVENDQCCDRGSGETRSGIGLRNVEARLMALYGERGRVETVRRQNSYIAIARMPLAIEASR